MRVISAVAPESGQGPRRVLLRRFLLKTGVAVHLALHLVLADQAWFGPAVQFQS
jgi:hypothetical protein